MEPMTDTAVHPVFQPNKTALITGGASGIGYSIAELCVLNQLRVIIVDINHNLLQQAAESLNQHSADQDLVKPLQLDVGDEQAWKALRAELEASSEEWRTIDLLVLNAATATKGQWDNASWWQEVRFADLTRLWLLD